MNKGDFIALLALETSLSQEDAVMFVEQLSNVGGGLTMAISTYTKYGYLGLLKYYEYAELINNFERG